MKKKKPRTLALCLVKYQNSILLNEGHDPKTQTRFYRPLGGGIQFGELAQDTIVREMQEEVGILVFQVSYLGMLENLFRYKGKARHEIILLFQAKFQNPSFYQQSFFPRLDKPSARAVWKSSEVFLAKKETLYPKGVFKFLS